MYKISILIVTVTMFLLIGCGISKQPRGDVMQEKTNPVFALCQAGNLIKLKEKSMIRFTFNVQLPDKTVSRNWMWDIERDIVYLDGQQVNRDDKRFVNDKYWLLFPLMAYDDRQHTKVIMNPKSQSPISKEPCIEIIVAYIDGGGYTPNDIYKLYCREDRRIFEWAYYKGGQSPPARVTQWEDYNEFNGIVLSMTRPSEGRFKVWFTDVSID